ncbi:hypothetical protein EVA_09691 [gut metagenome]|uniref:Uncharacterized protein n=1 Tax=gut metagenome TaxID=749906 RepID=J9GJK1_9ZZZZ
MLEVLGLFQLILKTLLMGEELYVILLFIHAICQIGSLLDLPYLVERDIVPKPVDQLLYRLLAHAINKKVGMAANKNTRQELILPIVVVGESPHGGLYSAQYDRHVGEKLLQYLRVNNGGVVWPHARTLVGSIRVVAPQPLVGCIMVDHGVHGSSRNTKE